MVAALLLNIKEGTSVVQAATTLECRLNDLVLTNTPVATGLCEWELVNNCPCEAFNIIAACQDRRWNQKIISRFAMEVDVPTFGHCTLLPTSKSNRLLRPPLRPHLPLRWHSSALPRQCRLRQPLPLIIETGRTTRSINIPLSDP
ncbi:hypothetical protein GOP47_0030901 [Adiantum capillus-veneris]|nr:hypothetical protein GOP47_0030901 [Adiantum capillus-veneris]